MTSQALQHGNIARLSDSLHSRCKQQAVIFGVVFSIEPSLRKRVKIEEGYG